MYVGDEVVMVLWRGGGCGGIDGGEGQVAVVDWMGGLMVAVEEDPRESMLGWSGWSLVNIDLGRV